MSAHVEHHLAYAAGKGADGKSAVAGSARATFWRAGYCLGHLGLA